MIPLSLLVAHFVGDFVLQSDWMAMNKSKLWWALTSHVSAYVLPFLIWSMLTLQNSEQLGIFIGLTFVTHFITDAITSRVTSKLWFFRDTDIAYNAGGKRYTLWVPMGGNRHYFFVMIGFDQLIHYGTLAWTLRLIG